MTCQWGNPCPWLDWFRLYWDVARGLFGFVMSEWLPALMLLIIVFALGWMLCEIWRVRR